MPHVAIHGDEAEVLVSSETVEALTQLVTDAQSHGVRRCTLVPATAPAEAIVPLEQLVPAVRAAVIRCRAAGIEARLERLPLCLLDGDAELVVPPDHHEPRDASCLFEALCDESERCPQLAHAYVARHGWEERRLRPTPRRTPWQPPPAKLTQAHAAWLDLLGPLAEQVERVELDRLALRYFTRMPGGHSLVIELRSRDNQRPAFARSRSFDISYVRAEGQPDQRDIAAFVQPIASAIIARDDGSLCLDPRDLPLLP